MLQKKHRNPKETVGANLRVNKEREGLNYHWFRTEGKEDLEIVEAMLETSLIDSFNSNCPVKTAQEKTA